jgi:hypothetical protein
MHTTLLIPTGLLAWNTTTPVMPAVVYQALKVVSACPGWIPARRVAVRRPKADAQDVEVDAIDAPITYIVVFSLHPLSTHKPLEKAQPYLSPS